MAQKWSNPLHFYPIAGVGVGEHEIEVSRNSNGHFRLHYFGWGKNGPSDEIQPGEKEMLAAVEKNLGGLARAMVAEGLRVCTVDAGSDDRSAGGRATETPKSSGACPL